MLIDDYYDGEERGQEYEIWKEKKENYDKCLSYKRLKLWLCEWNDIDFGFLFI